MLSEIHLLSIFAALFFCGLTKANDADDVYVINPFAGSGEPGSDGDGGPAFEAEFDSPAGISGNAAGDIIYISELGLDGGGNGRVRKISGVSPARDGISDDAEIETVIGIDGVDSDSVGGIVLESPQFLWFDEATQHLFVSDFGADVVHNISTLGDESIVSLSNISNPRGVWSDGADNLFVVEAAWHQILKIFYEERNSTDNFNSTFNGTSNVLFNSTLNGTEQAVVLDTYWVYVRTVVAGTGEEGLCGDGGPGTAAQLASPTALWGDSTGTLFVIDNGNRRLRVLSPSVDSGSAGGASYIIDTFFELDFKWHWGLWGWEGDLGGGVTAGLLFVTNKHSPAAVTRIEYDPSTSAALSSSAVVIAGGGWLNVSEAEGRAATLANLSTPRGVWGDAAGSVYFVEQQAHRVRSLFVVNATAEPTNSPTRENFCHIEVPCDFPTSQPTYQPSSQPSSQPSIQPTFRPTTRNQTTLQPNLFNMSTSPTIPTPRATSSPTSSPTLLRPSLAPSTPGPGPPSAAPTNNGLQNDDLDRDRASSDSQSSSSGRFRFSGSNYVVGYISGLITAGTISVCCLCYCWQLLLMCCRTGAISSKIYEQNNQDDDVEWGVGDVVDIINGQLLLLSQLNPIVVGGVALPFIEGLAFSIEDALDVMPSVIYEDEASGDVYSVGTCDIPVVPPRSISVPPDGTLSDALRLVIAEDQKPLDQQIRWELPPTLPPDTIFSAENYLNAVCTIDDLPVSTALGSFDYAVRCMGSASVGIGQYGHALELSSINLSIPTADWTILSEGMQILN